MLMITTHNKLLDIDVIDSYINDTEKTELFEKFSDVKNHASKTNDICKELSNYFKLCYFDSDDVFTYYEGFWDTLNSFYDELHKTYTSKREYNMLKEKVLNQ